MEIVGYSDPLSVAPGDRIRFMVSTRAPSFRASLGRLAGAGGPDEVESEISGEYPGRAQELRLGSYVVVAEAPPLEPGSPLALEAWVWPTAPGKRAQAIAGRFDGTRGYAVGLDEDGAATLWLDGQMVSTGVPLRRRAW